MVENPVFDLKIKHFPSVHGCGDKQFCDTWNSIQLNKLKKNALMNEYMNTLMAQGGVIAQITYCLILKYKKIVTLMWATGSIVIFL